jgi:hypothetical protein
MYGRADEDARHPEAADFERHNEYDNSAKPQSPFTIHQKDLLSAVCGETPTTWRAFQPRSANRFAHAGRSGEDVHQGTAL